MTTELLVLVLAALLHTVQMLLYAVPLNLQLGPGYAMSARDRPPSQELSIAPARLKRAYENHTEWLVVYAIAAVVIALTGQSTALTAACAWVYLGARVVYVPAYALGWRPGRSVVWAVGWLATMVMLVAALL